MTSPAETDARAIRSFARANRARLSLAYGLTMVENLSDLLRPAFLGWAVNDLLAASPRGFVFLLAHRAVHAALAAARRGYETAAFTVMAAALATAVVLRQRAVGVGPSQVAARAALSRQVVDFFERDVTLVLRTVLVLAGSLGLLAYYDPLLAAACAAVTTPAVALCRGYAAKARERNGALHDEMECEVDVVRRACAAGVVGHFRRIAVRRRSLGYAEARVMVGMELAALLPLCVLLGRFTGHAVCDAGHVTTVLGYVMMYTLGLTNLRVLAELRGRLQDIGDRLGDRHERLPTDGRSAETRAECCPGARAQAE